MAFLSVSGIRKRGESDFVLNDITFSLDQFRKIAIAGETGSGKSTLLKIIAGLIQADSGEVQFENKRVVGPDDKLVPGHPGISYLSQHFELPKFLRVEQVLAYANTLDDKEADTLFEVCHITHLLHRKTNELSGGEKQRIALARLLISTPKLLLLDEPFSNLDMVHKAILKSVIHDIGERLKITCILVSHDPLDTLSWAHEIIVMKDGLIIQHAPPEQIYRKPVTLYVGALFGKYNLIKANETAFLTPSFQGKDLFIRPENFKIAANEKGAFEVKVRKVFYFGSYYELEVQYRDTVFSVNVRAGSNIYRSGDTLYFTVESENLWHFGESSSK